MELIQLTKRAITVFLLLLSITFTAIAAIIIWALIESTTGQNTMEFEDVLLCSFFLCISFTFAFLYWFFAIKSIRGTKFSKRVFVGLKFLLCIFGVTALLFSWFSTISYSSSYFVFNLTTYLLISVGLIHILFFGLLFIPRVKNDLIE
jgi:hypothetical protein